MSRKENETSLSRDDLACTILVATIWGERLLYYVRSVLLRLPFIGQFADPFIGIVIVAVILVTLRYAKKKIELSDIAFVFGCLLIYVCHMAIYFNNYPFLVDIMPKFVFMVLPYFLLGIVCDIDKCINLLIKVSFAYVILGVLYYYYVTTVVGTYVMNTGEEMGIAYQFLPHVLLLSYATLKKFNILYLAGLVIGFFMLLGTGNRGSVLLVVIFFSLYFLFGTKRSILTKTIIIVTALIVFINLNAVIEFLADLFGEMGLSIRTLQLLEANEFADDNGRFAMNSIMDNAKQNSPIFGYGLCGDRVFLGVYCHNLYNELIISFGWLIGLTAFSCIVILVIKSYLCCFTKDQLFFLFLLVCCGFIKLFISNSFLEERYFFFLIGYSISIIRNKDNNLKQFKTDETISNTQHLLSDSNAPAIMHEKGGQEY